MKEEKQAIVWVSFGVADREAGERSLAAAAREIAAAFPEFDLFSAYTANFVRRHMAAAGLKVFSLDEVLARLASQGYRRVLIQPSHLTAGEEFARKILPAAHKYREAFPCLLLGSPVLAEEESYPELLKLISRLAAPQAKEELVLLGHGSPHRHNPAYEKLQLVADEMKLPIHIGVVEETDSPNFREVLNRLQTKQAADILLAPLLLTSGSHVKEDMAGDGAASWQSRLKSAGFQVRTSLKGLGEYREFRQIYLDKLEKLVKLGYND